MSNLIPNIDEEEIWEDLNLDETALQSLLDNPVEAPDTSRLRDGEKHEGFDSNMGESWIYPNNLPYRSYQMSIVQAALYRNTLVVLPTGLGKTFIAAVVMYNIYRWYPRGKIIFMAPTRPLVNQQIEACKKIMPFPKKDTVELTGKLQKAKRSEMWKTKRVFFATPQVVQSDIFGGRQPGGDSVNEYSYQESAEQENKTDFPFDLVKLIVIDEAHKAKGKYAYTEVAQAIAKHTKYFRVLALSATPGRTMEDVAEVCRNLFISHLEVRWDTSVDVLPYVHKRSMDTVVVSMGDKIKEIREQLLKIVDPYLRQLTEAEVLSGSLTNINRNFLLYEQKRFRDRSFNLGRHQQHSTISTNFAICISLYHAVELLERHGLRVFLNNFEEDEEGKDKFVLKMDRRLNDLVENLKTQMGPNPFEISAAPMTNGKIAEIPKDLDFGHPKFEKTRECLLRHFKNNEDSRAIVFCEYRESVMLIYRMLLQHVPLLKPRCFVGQGGSGSLRALTQKQQMQIMNDFRSGKSNILIATSIGEEGIDVGEVELIVCFDITTSNPTRFVQRIGRTGRRKKGHVIMMVTEGREQQLLREVIANKDQINKKLLKSTVVQQSLYKNDSRLVPTEIKPKCLQTYVKSPSDDDEMPSSKCKKLPRNENKSPESGNQDLRKYFQKKSKELNEQDMDFFETNTSMTQARPGVQTQQKIVNKLDKMNHLFKDLQSSIATQTQQAPKNSQSKANNSQVSIKDFFKDSETKNKSNDSLNRTLNCSERSIKDLSENSINLCDEGNCKNPTALEEADIPWLKHVDPERLPDLVKLFNMSCITPEVLKRAEINDLGYHLKSKELSREMKKWLLQVAPEYITENLEQMQVLKALYDNETSSYTEEEKSIREINEIIIDLFGGLDKVEKFLEDLEIEKVKQKCLNSDSESEEDDPEQLLKFQQKLHSILDDLGDGKRHDNYDWIQERLKQTRYHQDLMKSKTANSVQESMVYEKSAEPEDENSINNFDDYSITESKYWNHCPEFDKTDIAFKSTPLQEAQNRPSKKEEGIKKTPFLARLEETEEDHEMKENKTHLANTIVDSKQVQNALEMLVEKLKENSLNETNLRSVSQETINSEHGKSVNKMEMDTVTVEDELDELENIFQAKRKDYETRRRQTESKLVSSNDFADFDLPDDNELLMAAKEAELKISQIQTNNNKKNDSSSLEDPDKTPDLSNLSDNSDTKGNVNSVAELNSASLKCTSELNLSYCEENKTVEKKKSLNASFPTPRKISLQQELDIDMEAFMEPFPEEQELVKTNYSSVRKEHFFKENLNVNPANLVRESPDLFADEHIRSPIIKPIVCKNLALTSKLAKINVRKCQPTFSTDNSTISPQKPVFSSQNPAQGINSPTNRIPTDKQKYEKSPSLFDMYMKSTKGKGKLPKSLTNASLLTASVKSERYIAKSPKNSTTMAVSQQNESIVARSRTSKASKRKIFDSDSEQEENEEHLSGVSSLETTNEENDKDDSDIEEVAATQTHEESSIIRRRKKRRLVNSLIEHEAGVSGSEQSEDETDHTIGCYVHDSVVVPSDDEDPDQASTSHMQAMYLQSIKSPQQKRGAFKIPAPRVYNDHSRIFSQAVLPDENYSQYQPDSFIVEEDDSLTNVNNDMAEVSMCPLEKAEKILKERRRVKKCRLITEEGVQEKNTRTSKKKVQIIEDSSDDDFE